MKVSNFLLLFVFFIGISTANALTDRFRVMWIDDPAHKATVGFNLTGSTTATIHYGEVDNGTNFAAYTFTKSPDRMVTARGMNNVFMRLTNLKPATKYFFVIRDGATTSARYWFKTAPDNPNTRLSIIAGGDSRDNIVDGAAGQNTTRLNANRMVAKLRADAVVFTGDMTLFDTESEWILWLQDWQLTFAADGRITPIIPAQGNHEVAIGRAGVSGGSASPSNTDDLALFNVLDVPNQLVYYATQFGGDLVRFYSLNSLAPLAATSDQTIWLNNDLTTSCARWKIPQYHFPTRPHSTSKSNKDGQRDNWSSAFENHGVRLVIESDAHLIKYTHPIKRSSTATTAEAGFVRDDLNGITYIGEGGWGADRRDADRTYPWTMGSEGGDFGDHFMWLFIDKDKIEIRTIQTESQPVTVAKTEADDRFTVPMGAMIWSPLALAGQPLIITKPIDVSGCSSFALPIVLGDFQGKAVGKNNLLEWFTVQEINNDFFEIQASTNGVFFNTIGNIKGKGNSTNTESYRFEDKNPLGQLTYYRLRQVDRDGKETFSQVVTVVNIQTLKFSLAAINPVPASEYVDIQFTMHQAGEVLLFIYDLNGKMLLQKPINGTIGMNILRESLNMPNGTYYLSLQKEGKRETKKLVVLK